LDIEQQRYVEALDLIAEMEEMSSEDKINKISSFAEILLLHLIKQEAEQRQIIAEMYQPALERASLETFEGRYDDQELGQKLSRGSIEQKALELNAAHQHG
jgi:hypothetical protein